MLPLFPLNTVLLPDGEIEVHVFEPRYTALLRHVEAKDGKFGVVFCEDMKNPEDTMTEYGCLAEIVETNPYQDGTTLVLAQGTKRFKVKKVDNKAKPFLMADVEYLKDEKDLDMDDPLIKSAEKYLSVYRHFLEDIDPDVVNENMCAPLRPEKSFCLIDQLLIPEEKRLQVLSINSCKERFELAVKMLQVEVERLKFLMTEPEEESFAVIN